MIRYVDFGPVMTAEPAIVCREAKLYVFAVGADLGHLARLCDKVFDHPTGGAVKCVPLGPWVVIIVGTIARVSGDNRDKPAVAERNVLVHVPVAVETASLPMVPALFSPYVWVDNPNSLVSGREVFGYAKTMGYVTIEPGGTHQDPLHFQLDTFGGKYGAPVWDWEQGKAFIRIERKGHTPGTIFSIVDLVSGLSAVGDILESWAETGVSEIFHKQFRALDDYHPGQPGQACHSQITRAEYVVFGTTQVAPLDHLYDIHIGDLVSHPIRHELGLESKYSSRPGYLMKTNFRVEHGDVLWTAE
jgi:hypothetical protein